MNYHFVVAVVPAGYWHDNGEPHPASLNIFRYDLENRRYWALGADGEWHEYTELQDLREVREAITDFSVR